MKNGRGRKGRPGGWEKTTLGNRAVLLKKSVRPTNIYLKEEKKIKKKKSGGKKRVRMSKERKPAGRKGGKSLKIIIRTTRSNCGKERPCRKEKPG